MSKPKNVAVTLNVEHDDKADEMELIKAFMNRNTSRNYTNLDPKCIKTRETLTTKSTTSIKETIIEFTNDGTETSTSKALVWKH